MGSCHPGAGEGAIVNKLWQNGTHRFTHHNRPKLRRHSSPTWPTAKKHQSHHPQSLSQPEVPRSTIHARLLLVGWVPQIDCRQPQNRRINHLPASVQPVYTCPSCATTTAHRIIMLRSKRRFQALYTRETSSCLYVGIPRVCCCAKQTQCFYIISFPPFFREEAWLGPVMSYNFLWL